MRAHELEVDIEHKCDHCDIVVWDVDDYTRVLRVNPQSPYSYLEKFKKYDWNGYNRQSMIARYLGDPKDNLHIGPEVPELLDKHKPLEEEHSEDGDGALDAAVAEANNISPVRTLSTCPIAGGEEVCQPAIIDCAPADLASVGHATSGSWCTAAGETDACH